MPGFSFNTRPELAEALALMCPGSHFRCDINPETGEYDYDHVVWENPANIDWTPPSKESVEAYLQQIQEEWDEKVKYKQLRAIAYPDLTELADAMYWQMQGDSTKMEAYLEKVAAVKEQFPKNDPTLPWRGSALGTIKGAFPDYTIMQNPSISLPTETFPYENNNQLPLE